MNKIFGLYKPKGITSQKAVKIVKSFYGGEKVGHAGTLDPLAEGILVIGVGREATKKLGSIVEKEKEYFATIKFGETSTTDDAEGGKSVRTVRNVPDVEIVRDVIQSFVGRFKQMPPTYSAVKVRGQEAYKRIRRGESFTLGVRDVEIKEIEILKYAWPYLKMRVVTGPGVYIRSLARDIGEKISVGAYLSALERTRVGQFTKENCHRIEEFQSINQSINQ